MVFELPFDAVVGRYVLQFPADPGATLRRLATLVPTGGLIAFHEPTGMVCGRSPACSDVRHVLGLDSRVVGHFQIGAWTVAS